MKDKIFNTIAKIVKILLILIFIFMIIFLVVELVEAVDTKTDISTCINNYYVSKDGKTYIQIVDAENVVYSINYDTHTYGIKNYENSTIILDNDTVIKIIDSSTLYVSDTRQYMRLYGGVI